MKKSIIKLISVAILIVCSSEQKAQSINFGITAGVSTGSVNVSEIGSAFTNTVKGDNILGYEAGIFARMNFNPLYVKGNFLLASRSGESIYSDNGGSSKKSSFSVKKIQVPILFGLKLIGPLRVEAGPVINWIISESHSSDNTFSLRKTGYGYRVGANVEFGILNLGLAYQGLKNKSNGPSTATYSTPDELIFSVGILLGGNSAK